MAYNYSNFVPQQPQPYTWQNYQTYTPVNTQPPVQQSSGGFIWVQGEAAAKAYPVAPGNSVLLMDSDEPVLYMKATDNTGRPLPLEVYDLVKREDSPSIPKVEIKSQHQIDLSEYVKISDLEAKVKEMTKEALDEFLIKKEVKK